MQRVLESITRRADRASARPFLWVNIGLAVFVLFSHGGALAVSIAKPDRAPQGVWQVAIFSLPLAMIVLVSGIVALRRGDLPPAFWPCTGWFLARPRRLCCSGP